MIKKIKIFSNENEKCQKIKTQLENLFLKNNFSMEEDFDLGIAIGGDGSFLRMLHQANFKDAFYIGIHAGTFGFSQEIDPEKLDLFVEKLKQNVFQIEEIGLLKTTITTKTEKISFLSLNEAIFQKENLGVCKYELYIDENLLETYAGDGLMVATSFGSTAYNLGFHGSIVPRNFSVIQITPMAPLYSPMYPSLKQSLVLPEQTKVRIKPVANFENFLITQDGKRKVFCDVQTIDLETEDRKIKLLSMDSYINTLRSKFLL